MGYVYTYHQIPLLLQVEFVLEPTKVLSKGQRTSEEDSRRRNDPNPTQPIDSERTKSPSLAKANIQLTIFCLLSVKSSGKIICGAAILRLISHSLLLFASA